MIGDNPIDGSQRSSQTSFPHAAHSNIFSETDRNQILSQPLPVHQQTLNSFLPGDLQL